MNKSGGGLVVEAKNAQKFFEAATFLIDNPDQYAKMRQLGLDYAKIKYSLDNKNS